MRCFWCNREATGEVWAGPYLVPACPEHGGEEEESSPPYPRRTSYQAHGGLPTVRGAPITRRTSYAPPGGDGLHHSTGIPSGLPSPAIETEGYPTFRHRKKAGWPTRSPQPSRTSPDRMTCVTPRR